MCTEGKLTKERTRNILYHELTQSMCKDISKDIDAWWDNRAASIQYATNRGDSRTMFHIVNELAGLQCNPLPSTILDQAGKHISEPQLRLRHWANHLEELLNRLHPLQLADVTGQPAPPGGPPIAQAVPAFHEV